MSSCYPGRISWVSNLVHAGVRAAVPFAWWTPGQGEWEKGHGFNCMLSRYPRLLAKPDALSDGIFVSVDWNELIRNI